jgi:hypothetical protein
LQPRTSALRASCRSSSTQNKPLSCHA